MLKMSDKVGEMFMVGYPGTDPMAASELIRHYHVGGIILFSRNVRNADHARSVCEKLQSLRREVSDSSLFIAIDQEGGCVARITDGVTVFPGNMALGAIGSEQLAHQAARATAAELLALGINVNFAPVLDISSNPRNPGIGARSFGRDPALVGRLGSAMIRGMQEERFCACAKHFPGLGEARVDSHNELPFVNTARNEMEDREFVPFRAAIEAGVDFVMTAHCSYSSLDSTLAPATLSRPILTDLLRQRMGFHGITITDCLEMAAVEKNLLPPQSVVHAVRAGATMLLICHTLQKQVDAIGSLIHSVEIGKIPEDVIDSGVATISTVKRRLKSLEVSASFASERSLSETIASNAIAIVKNEDSMIPLKLGPSDKLGLVIPSFELLTKVEEAAESHEGFLGEMERHHPRLLYCKVPVEPTPAEAKQCLNVCKDADVILALTYNLHLYRAQKDFISTLLDLGKPTVVAAVRDPYDLAFVPKARASVATYSFRECSLKALASVLFGKLEAKGQLPVELH